MKEHVRANGAVTIRLPDSAGRMRNAAARVPAGTAGQETRGARRGGREQADLSDASELDILLDALGEDDSPLNHELELVDQFAVNVGGDEADAAVTRPGGATRGTARGATRGATRGGPRRGPADGGNDDRQAMDIDLALDAGESAVVLIEQDGTYEWHFPDKRRAPAPVRRRGPVAPDAQAPATTVSFRIPIGETGRLPRPTRGNRTHRGPITNFIKGKVRGFILKFIARKAVGALSRRLERGVKAGPVVVNSANDATLWPHVDQYPLAGLPTDRPRRILLLVHGTFSSTVGSYGALTTHAEGQAMLTLALAHYDLVVGFDHYTLSETPEQNADQMLGALMPLVEGGQALEIDAIAFSRGGLVYRYLSEIAIPETHLPLLFRTAVFVGCTNNGTELANDKNWKHLVDFYTNMIAGASRLTGLLPGAALPSLILREGIKVVGSLVTYMAQDGVADNSVPGIAAMEPDGSFVTALNRIPEELRRPAARAYYAIGSDFEPTTNDDASKLGKRLVLKVADGLVDRLMGKANDLVVNNDSMFAIDPAPGSRLLEQRAVQSNGRIYHTVYFHQAMVADLCSRWLEPEVASTPGNTRSAASRTVASGHVMPRAWWNDAVTADLLQLPFNGSVGDTRKRLASSEARAVVLQRLHEGELLHYGFTPAALARVVKRHSDPHASIGDVLGLHEWQSRTMSIDTALASESAAGLRKAAAALVHEQGFPGSDLAVIIENGAPVGVILPASELAPGSAPVSAPGSALGASPPPAPQPMPMPVPGPAPGPEPMSTPRPTSGGTRGQRESAAPGARPQPAPTTSTEPKPEPNRTWCHLHANMAEEANSGTVAPLEVTISRDLIVRESGIAGSGQVSTDRPLIIQVLARKHCAVIDQDRVELAIPEPGVEIPIFFDIKVLHEGAGEIDIYARQGNQPIIHLKLRPRFVKPAAEASSRTTAVSGTLTPAVDRPELADVLYIHDVQVGAERMLEFRLYAPSLDYQGSARSKPFKSEGARLEYINNLYKEIEEFWADNHDDYDAFMQHLMARGANLFETLVPTDIKARLWKARDSIKAIQVISEEPFIPWELLYLKPPGKPATADSFFLVERGMFRWIANHQYAPTELRLRDGAFKHIVPKYPQASGYALEGAQQESRMLEADFDASPISATGKAVRKALAAPGQHDILHFACHGLAESDEIYNASLMMKGRMEGNEFIKDKLSYEWTSAFANLADTDGRGPLVFLNACQTGRQGHNLTGTGGFAHAFLKAGASAFVGAHWSVGDQPALTFSKTFYHELIEKQSSMIEAVNRARESAKNRQEVTWLAYAVYADPYARFDKS